MKTKQKKKNKPPIITLENKYDDLYEESSKIIINKKEDIKEKEPEKPKKQKKSKSLLDQDFEF